MLFVIAGVTASGKSNLSIELARYTKGEIVNADSLQQYSELPLLTAQPCCKSLSTIPHHGFSRLEGNHKANVYSWLSYTLNRISFLSKLKRSVIVCGGTGLYIEALLKGLSPIPNVPKEIVADLELLSDLQLKEQRIIITNQSTGDSNTFDRQRQIRDLSLLIHTGKGLKEWQNIPRSKVSNLLMPNHKNNYNNVFVFLPDRDLLRQAIIKRFSEMLKNGLLIEVKQSLEILNDKSPCVKACGWRALVEHINGNLSLSDAMDSCVTETMQYAKRQSTWFRNRLGKAKIINDFAKNSLELILGNSNIKD